MNHGETLMAGLLSKEPTIAKPGFNRWLVPPAAFAIHLCIGMAYGFSVFWLSVMYTPVFRVSRFFGGGIRALAGT